MARPLPKDVEDRIKGASSKAEWRSGLFMGFVVGTAVGFGVGLNFKDLTSGVSGFAIGLGVVIGVWFLAARARRHWIAKDKAVKAEKAEKTEQSDQS